MKHVRIATYEIKKGSFQELADVAQDGMLREFRNQPGFIRYGLADSGDKTCVSLSLWETRKDADHAVAVSEAWTVPTSPTGPSSARPISVTLPSTKAFPRRSDRPSGR